MVEKNNGSGDGSVVFNSSQIDLFRSYGNFLEASVSMDPGERALERLQEAVDRVYSGLNTDENWRTFQQDYGRYLEFLKSENAYKSLVSHPSQRVLPFMDRGRSRDCARA